ncbi:hypothetical protein AAZV13_05G086650 [Glycine max]
MVKNTLNPNTFSPSSSHCPSRMLLKVVKFFRLMLLEVAKKATTMLSSHASTRLTPNSYRTRRSLRSTTTSVLPSLASPSRPCPLLLHAIRVSTLNMMSSSSYRSCRVRV